MIVHRRAVAEHFQDIVKTEMEIELGVIPEDARQGYVLWQSRQNLDELDECVRNLGGCPGLVEPLVEFFQLKVIQVQGDVAVRLERVMAMSLSVILKKGYGAECLKRFLQFVEKSIKRSAYLVALIENPKSIRDLLYVMDQSPWLASVIIEHPFLIDEVIDFQPLKQPLNKVELLRELQHRLLKGKDGDIEYYLDAIRYYFYGHSVRVALSDLYGSLTLMHVSDCLTHMAETIVEETVVLAWRELTARHGPPPTAEKKSSDERPFAVIAYGKLGGIEMSYSSDLDLVFLHDSPTSGQTLGEKGIDVGLFYLKLAQKIINYLSVRTRAGALYEVDTRLRPSGHSGLLVSTFSAFSKYQRESAWIWEKQALVRARLILGAGPLTETFIQMRNEALQSIDDYQSLRDELVGMRDKMVTNLGSMSGAAVGRAEYVALSDADAHFDIKHDPGGMVDIEFLVQYLVLRNCSDVPELLSYPDNMRLLDGFEQAEILASEQVAALQNAYLSYRWALHGQFLKGQAEQKASIGQWSAHRSIVLANWEGLLAPSGP